MNRFNKACSLILLSIFASSLCAHEFKSFKLTPKFYNQPEKNTPLIMAKKLVTVSKMSTTSTPVALPQEQTTLYDNILSYLTPNYTHIGDTQSASLLNFNRSYDLGQQNYSGFTWQRPLANFYIGADRQVEPDLFDDKRWLIKDKFTISVNAFTYLSNLQAEQKLDISTTQLAAFAGMEFIRIYRYTHFADSFTEALTKEYNKLFLSFLLFRGDGFQNMAPYEFVTKEDYLSINAGGMVKVPTIPLVTGVGININVGALIEYKKMAQLTLQALGPKDGGVNGDKLRVSYEVSNEKSVTVQASLEADFLNLLKLSLLSYELEYNLKDSDKIYLTFDEAGFNQLSEGGSLATDFAQLLKLNRPQDLTTLQPFITSRERRVSENSSSRYSILLLGGAREQESGQVIIDTNEEQKIFYKSFNQHIKYVRWFFRTILDSFFQTIFHTNLAKNYKSSRLRKLAIEYEYTPDIGTNDNDVVIEQDGNLSFNITHQFTAGKTHGFWNKKYKTYAKLFTTGFTTLPEAYNSALSSTSLRGPLSIKTVFRIGKQQLVYLNSITPPQMQQKLHLVCKSVSSRKSKVARCEKNIWKEYLKYYNNWLPHHDMAIASLKNFINKLNTYVDSAQDIRYVFGENTFFSGTFSASNPEGKTHLTFFKDGTFEGLGVIDNYTRTEVTRSPASIVH